MDLFHRLAGKFGDDIAAETLARAYEWIKDELILSPTTWAWRTARNLEKMEARRGRKSLAHPPIVYEPLPKSGAAPHPNLSAEPEQERRVIAREELQAQPWSRVERAFNGRRSPVRKRRPKQPGHRQSSA
jgi:DNA-directed RNA polymerase specialized sigma24 family protein